MDIRLTLLARQDLEDLRRFTIDTWGQEQWRRYFAGIVLAFEGVARDGRAICVTGCGPCPTRSILSSSNPSIMPKERLSSCGSCINRGTSRHSHTATRPKAKPTHS